MYKLIEKGYLPNISGLIWILHISKPVTVNEWTQYADELLLGYLCYP